MALDFIMANDISDAISKKNCNNVFLAGGTEINRLNSSVDTLGVISLKKVKDLKKIITEGEYILIGSMVTFQEALENNEIPKYLKDGILYMNSRTKRNMATLGGNIGSLRDDSYILPVLLASKTKLILLDGNKEVEIDISEYVNNNKNYKNLLIKCIKVNKNINVASHRFSNTAQSHSAINMAMSKTDGKYTLYAAIKFGGIYNCSKISDAINENNNISEEELINISRNYKEIKVSTDFLGSEDYKRYLLGVESHLLLEELKKGDR